MRGSRLVRVLLAVALVTGPASACGALKANSPATTITVWDFYGSASPIRPVLAAFAKEHPGIVVKYEQHDYDQVQRQFPQAAARRDGPDVSTLDMTWLPSLAADGLLADLTPLSRGRINGRRIDHVYASAALRSMTFENRYVAAAYDYDAYALYYRADLLAEVGQPVPRTWTQLRAVAKALARDAADRGQPGAARTQVKPDTYHFAQLLFQNGGELLDTTNTRALFAGPQGVKALEQYAGLLKDGGVYWGPENETDPQGVTAMKDGRIAMFIDGPYLMGALKSQAPELAGRWGVAPVPTDGEPASYLGGTGLGIPTSSKKKEAAWRFVEFLLRKENQLGVLTHAGGAPTTNEAVLSAELADSDPYFGGQTPYLTFLAAVATAKHFPYVRQWGEISTILDEALVLALTGKRPPKEALQDAAAKVDAALQQT